MTIAVQDLERDGVVKARRGVITVRDRAGLLRVAGEAYGTPEAEAARLFGIDFRTAIASGNEPSP